MLFTTSVSKVYSFGHLEVKLQIFNEETRTGSAGICFTLHISFVRIVKFKNFDLQIILTAKFEFQ